MEVNSRLIEPNRMSTSNWNDVIEIIFLSFSFLFELFLIYCILLFLDEDFWNHEYLELVLDNSKYSQGSER